MVSQAAVKSKTRIVDSNFPDENPNPVMRISTQGQLLYANRASAPLLKSWQQQAGGNIQGESLSALTEAAHSGSLRQVDFSCEDRVFTVVFAPVSGSDYLNVYALDTTEMKKAELALQAALDEIGQLKNRLQRENRYLQDEIKQVHGAEAIIGDSDAQKKLLRSVKQVTRTRCHGADNRGNRNRQGVNRAGNPCR